LLLKNKCYAMSTNTPNCNINVKQIEELPAKFPVKVYNEAIAISHFKRKLLNLGVISSKNHYSNGVKERFYD